MYQVPMSAVTITHAHTYTHMHAQAHVHTHTYTLMLLCLMNTISPNLVPRGWWYSCRVRPWHMQGLGLHPHHCNQIESTRAGVTAQQLRTHTHLQRIGSLDPRAQVRWLKTDCNSSSRGSETSHCHGHLHSFTCTPSYTYFKMKQIWI